MRKFLDSYYQLLNVLLGASVGILIVPVTIQMIARNTGLLPNWIWTEEMARFFFIWMVMLGAMIGVRDASHFECDVWPELKPRANALLRVVSTVFVLVFALTGSFSSHRIRDWIDGFGAAGPLVFIVVSSLLTVVLFPGPLLSAASGLLFGTALGTPVSIVAATTGASLAFALSRWWAHDAVVETFGHHRRLIALRAWVGARGFESVLLARVAPGMPYNLVNYAAGMTPVALGTFALATLIGVAPRAFAYTALGGSIGNLGSPAAIVAVCLLVAEGAVGIWLLRAAGPGTARSTRDDRSAGPP